MSSARIASAAWLVWLSAAGCDTREAGPASDVAAAPDAQPGPTADSASDPQLAAARASLRGGRIDPGLERELLASDAPEHARARRLLGAMAAEGSKESEATPSKKGSTDGPVAITPPTLGGTQPPDATGGSKPSSSTSNSTSSSGASTSASASPSSGEETRSAPRLAMLTRLRLDGGEERVTLRLNAADRIVVGLAEQPQSGLVRLVVESAGALPAFLQSRPKLHGVEVVDVRRGEDTVQISVSLAPGWRARGPRSGSKDASIDFVRE